LKFGFTIPNGIPVSEKILLFQEKKMTLTDALYYLFLKYIVAGDAILEINIPSSERESLMLQFPSNTNRYNATNFLVGDDKTAMEVVLPLFEQCAREIYSLIHDSYVRFKKTDVFEKVNTQRKKSEK